MSEERKQGTPMHDLKVGDRVRLLDVKRKRNKHIFIPPGTEGVVTEISYNVPDAVNVSMHGGHGAIEVAALEKI